MTGEETAGCSQTSTLDPGQADVEPSQTRCDFTVKGRLERVGELS